jgi:Putative F0F1-ATPase subunit Ca2+/Mg2+ transporter
MGKNSSDLKDAMFNAGDAVIGAAVLVFIGVFAGNWLDAKLHSSPWCVVCFSLLGAGLGLWRMVRKAMTIGGGSTPDPLEQSGKFTNTGSKFTNTGTGDDTAASEAGVQPRSESGTGSGSHSTSGAKRKPEPGARSAFDFLDQGDSK